MFGKLFGRIKLAILLVFPPLVSLTACAKPQDAPPQLQVAPPAPVVAKVIVAAPCVVETVPMPDYPGDLSRDDDDVYTAARLAMADRRVRIAERDRLRAANADPCQANAEARP